jgi:transcription antitermination factor NusG
VSIFEGEEDFTSETAQERARESAGESGRWEEGDRVRVVDGPRMLIGATGTVVEVDVPGEWPVRVNVDRAGFDRALLAPDELEPADGVAS